MDLTGNDVCKLDNYRDNVFKAIPSLECLDGKNQDGDSIESLDEDDDEENYGEEGENDFDNMNEEIIQRLDPEMREKYLRGELNEEELKNMFIDDSDYNDEIDETCELDQDGALEDSEEEHACDGHGHGKEDGDDDDYGSSDGDAGPTKKPKAE